MIGLALVTLCATLFNGFLASTRTADEDAVSADYVVTSKGGFDTIPAAAGSAVARAPGVKSVSAVRQDEAKAFGDKVVVNGLPPGLNDTVNLGLDHGADAVIPRLGASGAIVAKSYADDHGLRVGGPLTLTTSAGRPVTVRVAAVADADAQLTGEVLISQAAFDASFPRPSDIYVFVRAKDGTNAATTEAIDRAVSGFPEVD